MELYLSIHLEEISSKGYRTDISGGSRFRVYSKEPCNALFVHMGITYRHQLHLIIIPNQRDLGIIRFQKGEQGETE